MTMSCYFFPTDCEFIMKSEPNALDVVRDFLRPGILKPLRLVVVYFFFFHAASLNAMRPYLIEVSSRLEVPISPKVLTVRTLYFSNSQSTLYTSSSIYNSQNLLCHLWRIVVENRTTRSWDFRAQIRKYDLIINNGAWE